MCRAARLLALVLLLLVVGCGGEEPGPEPADVYRAELFPSSAVLSGNTLERLLSDEDGRLRFDGVPAQLSELGGTHVLIAGKSQAQPSGFMRWIVDATIDEGDLVLDTRDVPVELAFRKLHVRATRSYAELTAPGAGGRVQATGGGDQSVVFHEPAFDGDDDPSTPDDQVMLTGTLQGSAKFQLGIDTDWGEIKALPSAVVDCLKKIFTGGSCDLESLVPEVKVTFDARVEAGADISLAGAAFLDYTREVTLPAIELPEFWIGPLGFFPAIELVGTIEGEASSRFDLSTKASIGLEIGVRASNKQGVKLTPPNAWFEASSPAVTATLKANSAVSFGPRLRLLLYKVMGPRAGLRLFTELDADMSRNPCWALEAGLRAEYGFYIGLPVPIIGDITLASFSDQLELFRKTVATGGCQALSGGDPASPTAGDPSAAAFAAPDFVPWSRAYAGVLDRHPNQAVGAAIAWSQATATVDGRFLLSSADGRALLKVTPDGTPVWARRYLAAEPWLESGSAEMLPGRVVHAKDGTVFVLAHPYSVLKVAASGQLHWAKRFEQTAGRSWLRFTDAVATSDGGLLAVAARDDEAVLANDAALWLVRLDAHGEVVWSKTLAAGGRRVVPRAVIRHGSDFTVAGSVYSPSNARWQAFAARVAGDGSTVWVRSVAATRCDGVEYGSHFHAGLATPEGDLVLAGALSFAGDNTLTLKLKPSGELAWSRAERTPVAAHLGPSIGSIVALPTSGYLVAGTYSGDLNAEDVFIAALDSIGRSQWVRAHGAANVPDTIHHDNDNFPSLVLTRDGGALVVAHSNGLLDAGLWGFKVFAKDGQIAFAPSTTAQSRDLTLEQAPACLDLVAESWLESDEPAGVAPLALTSESVAISVTQQAP